MKITTIFISLLALMSCNRNKIDYESFKKAQDYNVPCTAISSETQSALFIFPHPDDEIVCGGTIASLEENGWTISLLTLTQGQSVNKSQRKEEWKKACAVFKFDHAELLDLPNNSWEDILNDKITFWNENLDSLENLVYQSIQKYRPSVIFTYDTVLGGYGHPEHIISAIAVNRVFQKHKSDSLFPVDRIMQITLPDKLEELLVSKAETYRKLKAKDERLTLPAPSIAFDITGYWDTKRESASKYTSQAGTLKKFRLLPEIKDTAIHYMTFDREYYFEIKK